MCFVGHREEEDFTCNSGRQLFLANLFYILTKLLKTGGDTMINVPCRPQLLFGYFLKCLHRPVSTIKKVCDSLRAFSKSTFSFGCCWKRCKEPWGTFPNVPWHTFELFFLVHFSQSSTLMFIKIKIWSFNRKFKNHCQVLSLLSCSPGPRLEKLVPYILARDYSGNRPSKTLY